MAKLRARIDRRAVPAVPVVIHLCHRWQASIGETAFAWHAALELAQRYPNGAVWVDLYGPHPGMTPREPSGALAKHAPQRKQ
jgi:hypothetical protein